MGRIRFLKLLLIGIGAALAWLAPLAARPLPPPPQGYVLDDSGVLSPQPQAPAPGETSPKDLKPLLILLGGLAGFVLLVVLLGGEMTLSSRGRVVYHRKFSGKYADLTLNFLQVLLAGIGLGGKSGYRGGGGKFGGGGASGSW